MDNTETQNALKLMAAARSYWDTCNINDPKRHDAVRWLTDQEGRLLIYTRGGYREQLLATLEKLKATETYYFEGEQIPRQPKDNPQTQLTNEEQEALRECEDIARSQLDSAKEGGDEETIARWTRRHALIRSRLARAVKENCIGVTDPEKPATGEAYKGSVTVLETVAEAVYEAMLFDRSSINCHSAPPSSPLVPAPPWVPGGNSLAQEEARNAARKILAFVHQGPPGDGWRLLHHDEIVLEGDEYLDTSAISFGWKPTRDAGEKAGGMLYRRRVEPVAEMLTAVREAIERLQRSVIDWKLEAEVHRTRAAAAVAEIARLREAVEITDAERSGLFRAKYRLLDCKMNEEAAVIEAILCRAEKEEGR